MVGKQSQVGEDLLNLLPVKKFANVGSRKQKRQTLKQQLSFPFSQAELGLLPDSSPPPLLSLQATLSPSPFREEASDVKGVLRDCYQGIVVSLFHSFLLIPFFSMYIICRLQRISALPWSTLSSDLGLLSSVSHSV